MLTSILGFIAIGQLQTNQQELEAVSFPPDGGSPSIVGRATIRSAMSVDRGRNLVWTHVSSQSKSGWRKEWTFDPKGELTFQSYEVSFGDLKSRWNLSREVGKWNLSGPTETEFPKKTGRVSDVSTLWFVEKKVSIGARARISALDTGNFTVRNGEAKYLRDERMPTATGEVVARVIEKKFLDGVEVWYVGDKGEIWRIDLVFPQANANTSYRPIIAP